MKYTIFLIQLILLLGCGAKPQSKVKDKTLKVSTQKEGELIGSGFDDISSEYQFETIETSVIDINNDKVTDSIIIQKIKDWDDPGDFHRIIFRYENNKEVTFSNIEGWVDITNFELQYTEGFSEKSLIKSDKILVQEVNDSEYLLFCYGYVYANKPGLLTIFHLNGKNNKPQLIFNKNTFLYSFKDIDFDGDKDLSVTIFDKQAFKQENIEKYYFEQKYFWKK